MNKTIVLLLISATIFLVSCDPKEKRDVVDDTLTARLIADSTYLYTKEVYLWNNLPGIGTYESFDPKKYVNTDYLQTANSVLGAIQALQPLDDFSFATSIEESDQIITGEGEDWGFFVKGALVANPASDANVRWFINYVYPASDAGLKGVKRGWILNKIGGVEIRGSQTSVNQLNNLFFGNVKSATIEFIKHDGTPVTQTINKTNFTVNGILYSNVFAGSGGKKIGYLVFNTFLGTGNARIEINNAFNTFSTNGIDELIVDLRNNLGGSTETQDLLANWLVPSAKNNTVMYAYEFNSQLQQGNFSLLKKKFGWNSDTFKPEFNTVMFNKVGSLDFDKLIFIVSDNTASASELLINSLKPAVDVKLIGDTTLGKPVGFFPIKLLDKVAIYPVSFRTINSEGIADYYNGFAPDKKTDDGINKDWGDVSEPCLANALAYLNTGSFLSASANTAMKGTLPRSVSNNKVLQIDSKRKARAGMYITPNEIIKR